MVTPSLNHLSPRDRVSLQASPPESISLHRQTLATTAKMDPPEPPVPPDPPPYAAQCSRSNLPRPHLAPPESSTTTHPHSLYSTLRQLTPLATTIVFILRLCPAHHTVPISSTSLLCLCQNCFTESPPRSFRATAALPGCQTTRPPARYSRYGNRVLSLTSGVLTERMGLSLWFKQHETMIYSKGHPPFGPLPAAVEQLAPTRTLAQNPNQGTVSLHWALIANGLQVMGLTIYLKYPDSKFVGPPHHLHVTPCRGDRIVLVGTQCYDLHVTSCRGDRTVLVGTQCYESVFQNNHQVIVTQGSSHHRWVLSALMAESLALKPLASLALKTALHAALASDLRHLNVFMDPQVLVTILSSTRVINEQKSLLFDIRCLVASFSFISFHHVSRALAKSVLLSFIVVLVSAA